MKWNANTPTALTWWWREKESECNVNEHERIERKTDSIIIEKSVLIITIAVYCKPIIVMVLYAVRIRAHNKKRHIYWYGIYTYVCVCVRTYAIITSYHHVNICTTKRSTDFKSNTINFNPIVLKYNVCEFCRCVCSLLNFACNIEACDNNKCYQWKCELLSYGCTIWIHKYVSMWMRLIDPMLKIISNLGNVTEWYKLSSKHVFWMTSNNCSIYVRVCSYSLS